MDLPYFPPGRGPGSSFVDLLRLSGVTTLAATGGATIDAGHATTVLAIRYRDGVVMAGDRRATAGNFISHRSIEKVFAADRHSGVAIAGAAGPAIEMVRMFQLQLEHYEKVESSELSLEGKANQLGSMVRANLPAAMQGLAVVPIFAGYDQRRAIGRLFQFDITGGRYEEQNYASSGSGSLHAATVVKLGFRPALTREEALALATEALFHAADEDSATGGPDPVRNIYPILATITATGFTRIPDEEAAATFAAIADRLRVQTTPPASVLGTEVPGHGTADTAEVDQP